MLKKRQKTRTTTNKQGSKKNKYLFKITKKDSSPRWRATETLQGYAGTLFLCVFLEHRQNDILQKKSFLLYISLAANTLRMSGKQVPFVLQNGNKSRMVQLQDQY